VPGAGFALIDQGKVVYEGGIGVKELGKPDRVDANTLFMAASNTKGMTTLLLAKLVDGKKLQWDEPVLKVYPSFKLADEIVTQQIEIKHLICACTGMPRQDLEWLFEYKKFKPESTFTLLSGMRTTSKFGEVFQYSNLMASAAGYIGAYVYELVGEPGAAYDHAMDAAAALAAALGTRVVTIRPVGLLAREALAGTRARFRHSTSPVYIRQILDITYWAPPDSNVLTCAA
jgi:CubicO group peptidase (beta-lactamase class C family)